MQCKALDLEGILPKLDHPFVASIGAKDLHDGIRVDLLLLLARLHAVLYVVPLQFLLAFVVLKVLGMLIDQVFGHARASMARAIL